MLLFALVLMGGIRVDVTDAEPDERVVFFEKLWQIEILSSVIRLLVEVHGPDTDLRAFEVRSDIDDEVIGTHVSEKADEASLVKLYQFLGNSDRFELFVVEPGIDKHISWQAHDVLFDERVTVRDKVHPIRRKEVFEFEAVNSRSIRLLDVEVVLVVVP